MYCPECKTENSDSAKFCKKCGKPLKPKTISHEQMINQISGQSNDSNNTTKIIIIALIIVAVVLAGAFIYISAFSNSDDAGESPAVQPSDEEEVQSTPTTQATVEEPQMTILGGSFSTGNSLSDKTYASVYVGPEFSGENVQIQILYSRDGSSLNDGNMVAKTVDSSGYINVASADSYKYYPDYAEINIYDASGKLMDTQAVNLSPQSGTQNF